MHFAWGPLGVWDHRGSGGAVYVRGRRDALRAFEKKNSFGMGSWRVEYGLGSAECLRLVDENAFGVYIYRKFLARLL